MTTQVKESVSVWPSSSREFRPDTSADVERRIRIAFVEDDDDYREAVSNELGDYGFDVTTFCDGTALLAAFAAGAEAEIGDAHRRPTGKGRPHRFEHGGIARRAIIGLAQREPLQGKAHDTPSTTAKKIRAVASHRGNRAAAARAAAA